MNGGTPRDVKRYRFGPGSLENVELEVWHTDDARGVLKARLWGIASTWSFLEAGPFHPEIFIELETDPESIREDDDTLMREAYDGNVMSAESLAEELKSMAHDEWLREMEQQMDL